VKKNQWRANELRIKGDSSIRLVQYDELALYDVIAVEDLRFIGLTRPVAHSR
jgi:hypothetical protein